MKFLQHRWAIIAILAAGIAVRVITLLLIADAPLISDADRYRWSAFHHYTGRSLFLYWPPGLPLYLSTIYDIFNDTSEILNRIAMLVFYPVSTLFLYQLVKETVSTWSANLVALIFTFFPAYIYHSVSPLTHLPVFTAIIIIIYITYKLTTGKRRLWLDLPAFVILGVVTGLVALFRASSLAILPAIPIYLVIKSKRFFAAVVSTLIAVVVISAYVADVSEQEGHLVLINYANSYNLFVGNSETTPLYRTWMFASEKDLRTEAFNAQLNFIESQPLSEQDSLYRDVVIEHVLERPDLFIIRTLNRTRAYFGFDTFSGTRLIAEGIVPTIVGLGVIAVDGLFYLFVMIPAVVYIAAYWNRWGMIPASLIGSVILLYSAPYFVAFAHSTYHFPVTPLFAVFGAALLDKLRTLEHRQEVIAAIRERRILVAIATIGFIFIQIEWTVIMTIDFLES